VEDGARVENNYRLNRLPGAGGFEPSEQKPEGYPTPTGDEEKVINGKV